ncbi:MAG: class B sortase [Solobacterium sp.]|nr:class B sortase [Erysipelotrichaceae bacterium]MBQ9154918.1 class B sortase [Solobacterium sp.]
MSEEFEKTQMIEIREPEKKPGKKKKLSKAGVILFSLLLIASVCGAGYSGYLFISTMLERKQGTGSYDDLSGKTVNVTQAPESEKTKIDIDFKSLAEINPDVVGWLMQDTSVINYPIVQNPDNEYYLNHLFTGEWNHMGCVFTHSDSDPDFMDYNTPLFAHGRKDGTMFGSLESYKSQEYYEQHKTFLLVTRKGKVYLLEAFAGSVNDATVPFLMTSFESDEQYISYVQHWFDVSDFRAEVWVYPGDRIVTMLTCTDDFQDARYALFCKMTDVTDQYEITAAD